MSAIDFKRLDRALSISETSRIGIRRTWANWKLAGSYRAMRDEIRRQRDEIREQREAIARFVARSDELIQAKLTAMESGDRANYEVDGAS